MSNTAATKPTKAELRKIVEENLDSVVEQLNKALRGDGLDDLAVVIKRLGRNQELPHWYQDLQVNKSLPNLDGKTVGSVLEMLFVAVLETGVFRFLGLGELKINPARGIDLPDLDLGVKSPSENLCTSEPFFSAYERLYGNEYDCVVLLTDYQTTKKRPPLKLQVLQARYLKGSQVADESLCKTALKHRDWLLKLDTSGAKAKRVFRFLAYVNQSDWRAKQLLGLISELNQEDEWFNRMIDLASKDFQNQNEQRFKKGRDLLPEDELDALKSIKEITPRYIGVIDQLDTWITETLKDASRAPNDNEWERLIRGQLDGKIGMSFALQWRYNFGKLFGERRKTSG